MINTNGAATSDALNHARESLSGKRTALIGFPEASVPDLMRIISEADAFARSLPSNIAPSADVLRPFELILVNVQDAAGTDWLKPDELSNVIDRCIALSPPSVLLTFVIHSALPFRQFCVWPAIPEELLLRCVLALRPTSSVKSPSAPSGSTIVLADDDPSITTLVRLTLQRNGMSCEVASNGGEALQLIQKLKPCAAVLDVSMPNIDGFEVLARIRNAPGTAPTRVILLTGSEQEADILRGFSLGADDYVTKPFNPMELMMRIKRVIGRL
ncbi:MAG: response regulator [Acidobacteriaceae bacterium]|nr:response regulator [Acidobacteriaceae bacterium]MBV9765451.1 response regulator [Acidobacteriaceae bacterium]